MEVERVLHICKFPDGSVEIIDMDDLSDWGDRDAKPEIIGEVTITFAEDITEASRQLVIRWANAFASG